MMKATKMAHGVKFTIYHKAKKLSKTRGKSPLYLVVMRLNSGEAGRGSASLGMIASLAGYEAFTQTQRANSLQFSLKVRVLPSYNLETGL